MRVRSGLINEMGGSEPLGSSKGKEEHDIYAYSSGLYLHHTLRCFTKQSREGTRSLGEREKLTKHCRRTVHDKRNDCIFIGLISVYLQTHAAHMIVRLKSTCRASSNFIGD